MTKKWRELDLEGGGLQAANLRLARTLRRRTVAWGLVLAFPLGVHRWYLGEWRSALLFPALTATAIAAWLGGYAAVALAALLALAMLLARDLYTLEDRVAACNKRQRMAVYLAQGPGAPAGFRGRFGADDAGTTGAAASRRLPTPAEQEALLREIAGRRTRPGREPQ